MYKKNFFCLGMENTYPFNCEKPFIKKFYMNNNEHILHGRDKGLSELERQLVSPKDLQKIFRWYEPIKEEKVFSETKKEALEEEKPNISYAEMIVRAISESEEGKLTLAQIYQWIKSNYKYYNKNDQVWQNSVRHNLSLNKMFKKIPRSPNTSGKGGFWTIDSTNLPKKPINERKVRENYKENESVIVNNMHLSNDINIMQIYNAKLYQ
ncbi:hypothetical protein H312_01559 [Anncaliia algerae PRA339]|uniref:Fork-head domain-containing protein n=1 Tax=Anncaliia algerae PRA339 TaxID=1288291 RepID=A0A059F1N6_9MICR|nr:hypothetical protein H312_01559 [Anncaliia algerae PRA339]